MKKIYSLSIGILFAAGLNAQVDTLTTHFVGTPTAYTVSGTDYVAGSNSYGDKAKFQLFDSSYGVTGGGTITNMLLWIAGYESVGGSIDVKVWENTGGQPGTELGSVNLPLTSIDTSASGLMVANGTVGYNVNIMFPTAITIPAGQSFWAGIVLPTTVGDTVGLVTTTDGDFSDADTHAAEWWSDDTWHSFGDDANWNIDIAMGIFPVVNITSSGASISENQIEVSTFPNPVEDVMNFVFEGSTAETVVIRNIEGRIVDQINVANNSTLVYGAEKIAAGTYIYEVRDNEGVVIAKNRFVKK